MFEDGKRYGIREFDTLMKQANEEQVAGAKAALEKYGTWQAWYESDDPENARFLGYDKVKFTVVMPDGTTYTERQDIGTVTGAFWTSSHNIPSTKTSFPCCSKVHHHKMIICF